MYLHNILKQQMHVITLLQAAKSMQCKKNNANNTSTFLVTIKDTIPSLSIIFFFRAAFFLKLTRESSSRVIWHLLKIPIFSFSWKATIIIIILRASFENLNHVIWFSDDFKLFRSDQTRFLNS